MTPEQRAQFIARIPDAEQRREAEKIFLVAHAAEHAFMQECLRRGIGTSTSAEENEREIQAAVDTDPDFKKLHDQGGLAAAPWNTNGEYGEPLESESGELIRCALTGFLVHETDKYLIDPSTLECVLKVAIGIPLGFVVGDFLNDDAPALALADDALNVSEIVNV